jgi:hypothetical protein
MIITQHPYEGKDNLVLTKSDSGYRIKQVETGEVYDEAVDVYPCRYTYTETDEPISPDGEATEQDYLNALAELGVTDDEESNS